MNEEYVHTPVLLNEVLDFLEVKPGGIYVDGTVGGGGHAEVILEKMKGQGLYIALDRDPETLNRARKRLERFGSQVLFVQDVFSQIPHVLKEHRIEAIDGLLIDLGVSSFQLDDPRRGFSFIKEGPLDMRMDPELLTSAADLVNELSEQELESIFKNFGEERFARRIARAIQEFRRARPFLTTSDLANLVQRSVPGPFRIPRARIHPATRIFQALRIAVNGELDHLASILNSDFCFFKPGGRICIISFHSLEDRQVKNVFRSSPILKVITKKPVIAQSEEMEKNPRSRSAKLRVAEKMDETLSAPSQPPKFKS